MASLCKVIKGVRHPLWLVDAIILSAVVYSKNPEEELEAMDKDYGLPSTAKYEFIPEEELRMAGFAGCRQTLLVVRSLTGGHLIVACRGTYDVSDALADLNIVHRTLSLGDGAAHAGFLDRAKSIPLEYFRRLLIRGENIVLTGHSLGGAVASLLALRLLEATGRWCHQQVQCYTFGCPFFADFRLAKYINSHYKQHFVHVVSKNDIVPKVMPLAYTLYNLWAGLQVGPLEDLFTCSRVAMVALQLTKTKFKVTDRIRFVAMASQAITWLPALCRVVLHRLIALALSHHSGYGYAFAGHMVLVDSQTRAFELADREGWTVERHLGFHFGGVSFDVVKDHSLLSYIDYVFAVQAAEASVGVATLGTADSTTVKVHVATINMKWFDTEPKQVKQKCMMGMEAEIQTTSHNNGRRKRAVRALRSKVACVIFARRLQEASPSTFKPRQRRGFFRFVLVNIARFSNFAQRFDKLLLASSMFCAGVQFQKFLTR